MNPHLNDVHQRVTNSNPRPCVHQLYQISRRPQRRQLTPDDMPGAIGNIGRKMSPATKALRVALRGLQSGLRDLWVLLAGCLRGLCVDRRVLTLELHRTHLRTSVLMFLPTCEPLCCAGFSSVDCRIPSCLERIACVAPLVRVWGAGVLPWVETSDGEGSALSPSAGRRRRSRKVGEAMAQEGASPELPPGTPGHADSECYGSLVGAIGRE